VACRILIADKLAEKAASILQKAGHIVDTKLGLSEAELAVIVPGYEAMLVRSAVKVTKKIIDASTDLKVIGRAGTGVDNIDVPAATARGILVMNVPGGNTVTAAEHTIALLFALARNVPQGDASLRAGQWERSRFTGRELTGKTLGLVGFGRIGRAVADRAMGLKMHVAAFDPLVPSFEMDGAGVKAVETLDELLAMSDVISVHTPMMASTRGLLNRETLAKAKKGVMIINCARGGVVDEASLVEALASGQVSGAALDVFEKEPPVGSPLLALPNVVLTPHLGASTKEAQTRVAIAVAEQVRDFLASGRRTGAVN
jgi:D-3-phosphoglycerate dehydrogenase